MKRLLFLLPFFTLLLSCTSGKEDTRQQALDFLYASMPLPDSVDYSRDFWLENIDCALEAREKMPWGKTIPEREWWHFVLPVRVNNENLDSARMVFYRELKPRVEHLSMADAILEVNHWCHEHVTYKPSDERTSAPLATLLMAVVARNLPSWLRPYAGWASPHVRSIRHAGLIPTITMPG